MDLFDLLEMFFDWKAASERGKESAMNLSAACKRFEISPQLQSILENTADRLESGGNDPRKNLKKSLDGCL